MASTASSSRTFAYRRVSSVKQSYERQTKALRDELARLGTPADEIENLIYEDKITGKTMDRPGFNLLIAKVARPGDEIIVSSLDRLGRTVLHALQTLEELENKGIKVRSLKEGEQFEGPTGKLVRNLMLMLAEWERENTAERAADARAARKDLGTYVPRGKTALAPENVTKIRQLRAEKMSADDIAKKLEMSRASVYRALAEA